MKKLLLLPLAISFVLGACGNQTAEQVAQGYLGNIQKADWSGACSLVEDASKEAIERATNKSCEDYLQSSQEATRFQGPYRPISIQKTRSWAKGTSGWGPFYMKESGGSWEISWLPPEWLIEAS